MRAGPDVAAVCGAIDVALLRAMAAGKPVISTRAGGVADFVSEGRTGLLTPPGDVARFAEAMVRLCCNASERLRLRQAARQSVAQRFGQDPAVEKLMRLYARGLIARRGLAARAPLR